jgi:hypothetical protein
MCCFFAILLVFGPRLADIVWWLLRPAYFQSIFRTWPVVWWLWPILGIIFLPWLTLMYLIVAPGGIVGFDWVWLGLALAVDIVSYGSGYNQRRSVPGMS